MYYKYKIQWAFWNRWDLFQFINLVWVRSLDVINIRDSSTSKIVDSYTSFRQYSSEVAEQKTKEYLESMEVEHEKMCKWIPLFEVIRK